MTSSPAKPLPVPDRDSRPFWDGVRAGELRVQRCTGCGAYRWPARAICNRCHGFESEWVALAGRGVVRSWVRTHQPFHPAFRDELPYDVVLVQLAEQDDIEMIGRLTEGAVPRAGMEVQAIFVPAGEDAVLVHWRPLGEGP